MKAWYFSESSKKLRYGDNRDIAIGVMHTFDCDPVPCSIGLHGSKRLSDAIQYAPGCVVWEVELGGKIVASEDGDKHAATERTYIAGGIDITDILRAHARWCALQVAHLWDMPAIVREYLETGDENKQYAAIATAANAATYAYAASAAYDAANAATYAYYAYSAAYDAAYSAAYDARAAALAAARAARAARAAATATSVANAATYAAVAAAALAALAALDATSAASRKSMRAKQERHILKLVRDAIKADSQRSK